MGSGFRQATYAEWLELLNNCFILRASSYHGVTANGFYVFKAKSSLDKGKIKWIDGEAAPSGLDYNSARDAHIFLPVGGYFDGKTRNNTSDGAFFYLGSLSHSGWSASDVASINACCLSITAGDRILDKANWERYFGFNLRGVRPYSAEESE